MKRKNNLDAVTIKPIHPDRFTTDFGANAILAAFYGVEMSSALNWSVEQRFMHLRQAQVMIEQRRSRMLIAYSPDKLPYGMIITTKTERPKIRRLDAIYVIEPQRRRGIATRLLNEAGGAKYDWHSYSARQSVDWHVRLGFRNLGNRPDDGTVEMFTGKYLPKYKFEYAAPVPTDFDRRAMQELKLSEELAKQQLT